MRPPGRPAPTTQGCPPSPGSNILASVDAEPEHRNGPRPRLKGSRGPYPYHDRKHLQVAVTLHDFFYGDETGTGGDARYLVLGGYIGSPRQWGLFDAEWRKVLGKYHVPAFHAIKFFQQAYWQSRSSPYHGWSDEKGIAFLARLLEIIDFRTILPMAAQ